MTERKVWYLAHPLKPDEKFTVEQNMEHVVRLTRIFFDHGIYVCTPYHTCMLALDDTNIEHRRMGIEMDNIVLRRLNKIILVGHKLSYGMAEELKLVQSQEGEVRDLTEISDIGVAAYCKMYADQMI